jgi:hypothetical protein
MCPYARRRSPSRLVSLDRFAHVLPTRDRDATFEFIEFIEHSRNSVKVLVSQSRARLARKKGAHETPQTLCGFCPDLAAHVFSH